MQLALKTYCPQGPIPDAGKDVVLIHGTGARAEMWQPQIDLLVDAGYRCFVPDLRGHGETHEPGEKTDLESHIKDILETLSCCDLRYPAVFAGHSLGSIISLVLAERQPEIFDKVLAVSMPGRVPALTSEIFRWFLGWPYKAIKSAQLHKHLAWRERVLIDTNHYTLQQIVSNFSTIDYSRNIPRPSCPVHFAVGRLDPVAPYVHVERMHKALPNSTLQVFEWAGHNCMDSQPEAFNKWFFEKLEQ